MQQSEIKTVRPPRELADKVRVAFNSVTYYGQFHVGDRNSDLITRLPGLANRIIRRESFSPQQLATLKERIVEAGGAESLSARF